MKIKREENSLVVSNKKKDLNEVLEKLASKDSKNVAAFLVQYASLPRELRIGALRLVLNDYVKMAKELVLSDEFMYRLNWYEKFSEYQLVNFWNILVSSNADKFNEQEEAVRFKKTFYLLLLLNADAVGFSDKELEALLRMHTAESTDETFKEFMNESDGAFYDYECNFDGMSYEDFKTVLKKCSTVADIRNIASKYGINVPKRLKKDELVALVLEGLRRQGKANEGTEAELKKMSAISLQRYAKVNGVKASTEMKKDDIIEYIMNRLDSSPKAVRKPRILLESLPELDDFEFSKDYLREVNIVDEEDEDDQFELPVAVIAEPEPMAEEPTPVVEEVVVEEVVAETAIEEDKIEESEEVEEETSASPETPEIPVNTPYNDELLVAITQLLVEKEQAKTNLSEERFNEIIELYEKRLNYLEDLVVTLGNKNANPAPVTINLTYPNQESQTVTVVPQEDEAPVVIVEEPKPMVEEVTEDNCEVSPVVVDSTFDTLTSNETVTVVEENMDGLSLKKGTVVVTADSVPSKPTKEEKRAIKKQLQEQKRLEKELVKEHKRAAKEKKRQAKAEKKAKREEKILAKEMAIAEKENYQLEKKKQKLERIKEKNEAANYKASKGKAFRRFIWTLILIIILLVIAVFTITTLIDLGFITGPFAEYVNNFADAYVPFLGTNEEVNAVRYNVSAVVRYIIEYINALIGYTPKAQ